jgi:hypothetical protein
MPVDTGPYRRRKQQFEELNSKEQRRTNGELSCAECRRHAGLQDLQHSELLLMLQPKVEAKM